MKRTKLILSLIVISLAVLLCMPNVVKADISTVTLQKIEITSPEGDYKTGDTITVVATYTGNIQNYSETSSQTLQMQFGKSGGTRIATGTISGKTITFTYTITDLDKGTLSIKRIQDSLRDEAGNYIPATSELPEVIGGEIVANPMEWTDTSNTEINITKSDDQYWKADFKLNNIEPIDGHRYYLYITTTNTQPELVLESNNDSVTPYHGTFSEGVGSVLSAKTEITDYYEYANAYFWLCEEQKNYDTDKYEQKFIIKGVELERPEQNKLGKRTKGYFSSSNNTESDKATNIFVYEPCSDTRNINIKIGKITDNSILLAIKNGEANCFQKLLTYAKSANSIYTGVVPVGSSSSITDNLNIVNGEYYYVYMELEDENGKYYTVEDVSLYQGLVNTKIGKNLYDYLSDEFKWNIDETEPESTNTIDNTISPKTIPQTGENLTIFAIVGLTIIISVVGFVKFRKNNF